jgi:hypothetical protein
MMMMMTYDSMKRKVVYVIVQVIQEVMIMVYDEHVNRPIAPFLLVRMVMLMVMVMIVLLLMRKRKRKNDEEQVHCDFLQMDPQDHRRQPQQLQQRLNSSAPAEY